MNTQSLKIRYGIFALIVMLMSACVPETPGVVPERENNFHNFEYRTGLWISIDQKDTLDFVSSTELIRKGYYYSYENYLYRIEDSILVISTLDAKISTYHPILKAEKDTVLLGNMYITIGFKDNSGIFVKQ